MQKLYGILCMIPNFPPTNDNIFSPFSALSGALGGKNKKSNPKSGAAFFAGNNFCFLLHFCAHTCNGGHKKMASPEFKKKRSPIILGGVRLFFPQKVEPKDFDSWTVALGLI